jgi:signal transduction histidine kinase
MPENSKTSGLEKNEKIRLENYLKKENPNLKAIFDHFNMGIIFINFKKQSVLFSNEFFRNIAFKKEKAIMENIYGHIRDNVDDPHRFSINQEIHVRDNGSNFLFGFSTYRIYDDIVAVLLSEIASKSIYVQSRQENEFFTKLSELVAEIAHEIGNPLSGINMSLQVLLFNLAIWPKEKITDYIERTISEINRLSLFLKRIRDISNENKLEMKSVNLRSIIQDVYRQNEEILKQKTIGFSNRIDDRITVELDEVAFFQIMLNLLRNSLQILEPGEQIEIFIESVDDFYIKLIYRNNGKPIPLESLGKIFSPFYTTKDRGDGIGLSISLKLMTRMGGTIKAVQPEDGIGAKFVIYIPNTLNG